MNSCPSRGAGYEVTNGLVTMLPREVDGGSAFVVCSVSDSSSSDGVWGGVELVGMSVMRMGSKIKISCTSSNNLSV